ncbi:MAG TPA: aldo/keto reductase, partial [Longimicrobiales bacterium]|nr:aldo/keto reductase [Longimicrobiales bacterium]
MTLATKVGARPAPGSYDLKDTLGLSLSSVRAQLTDSLRRLGTGHVEVLYAHIDDPATPLEDTVSAMSDLVDEGLVGQIAASNLPAPRLTQALTAPARHRYTALQQRFS